MNNRPPQGILKSCPICGKEFYVAPAKISRRKYCSRACMAVAYHELPSGRTPKGIYKTCPICDKEFYVIPAMIEAKKYCSRKCMAIAYRQFPDKNCPGCGKQFHPDPSDQVYCSRDCFEAFGRFKPTTTKVCEQCGITFEVTPCHENKKFCSKACSDKHLINRITKNCKKCGKPFEVVPVLKDRSFYCSKACREANIHINCAYCGKSFYIMPSEVSKRRTCSRKCLARQRVREGTSPVLNKENHKRGVEHSQQFYREHPEKHPFYTDGAYANGRLWRGPSWKQQRNAARERDNYTCQLCGITEDKMSRQLSVHHKIPYRNFASHEEANVLDNLICYCQPCHLKIERLERRRKSA